MVWGYPHCHGRVTGIITVMTFKLGLTGSIGMGKSTTAGFFADHGCAVWDADAAVHRLYAAGGPAADPVAAVFPTAVQNGAVSRDMLKQELMADPTKFKALEQIIHPLVAQDRADFIATATTDIVVLDIPLLFETGADRAMDAVACVSIDAETQKQRVMARQTMDEKTFQQILDRQWPNADKVAKSDYVIHTDSLDHAKQQVADIVNTIRTSINA